MYLWLYGKSHALAWLIFERFGLDNLIWIWLSLVILISIWIWFGRSYLDLVSWVHTSFGFEFGLGDLIWIWLSLVMLIWIWICFGWPHLDLVDWVTSLTLLLLIFQLRKLSLGFIQVFCGFTELKVRLWLHDHKKRLAEYLMFNNANRIIKLSAIQFGLTKKLNMHKVISDSVWYLIIFFYWL